jgi:hypothetical protein
MRNIWLNLYSIVMASGAMYFLVDNNYERATLCVSLTILSRVESLILLTKEKDK